MEKENGETKSNDVSGVQETDQGKETLAVKECADPPPAPPAAKSCPWPGIFALIVGFGVLITVAYLGGYSKGHTDGRSTEGASAETDEAASLPPMVRLPVLSRISTEEMIRFGDGTIDKEAWASERHMDDTECYTVPGSIAERIHADDKFVTVRYRAVPSKGRFDCPNESVFLMSRYDYERAEEQYVEHLARERAVRRAIQQLK